VSKGEGYGVCDGEGLLSFSNRFIGGDGRPRDLGVVSVKIFLAVDPGASGGFAISYGSDLDDVEVRPWVDETTWLIDLSELADHPDADSLVAIVEHVPPYVGRAIPSSAAFKLGKNFGYICGTIRALQIPLHLSKPQEWQKGLEGVRAAKGSKKKRVLRDHANRLFPTTKGVTLKTADALLILNHFLNNK